MEAAPALRPTLARSAWASRRTLASGLAIALAPKCPLCVIGYLSAIGIGAGAAARLAGALVPALVAAAAIALAGVAVRVVRTARRSRRIAPALAVAAAVVVAAIGWAAGAPLAVRLIALGGLAAALAWGYDGAPCPSMSRFPSSTRRA